MPDMNLQSFLDRVNIKQADLAKAIDTSPGNVNRWAKGEGVPSYELCVKLLELGMTTEELFGVSTHKEIVLDDLEARVKQILIRALEK